MIRVPRDLEGIALTFDQMLEREHDLFRLGPKLKGKDLAIQQLILSQAARVTFSPGYERWCQHLLLLEAQHKLGLSLGDLLAVEVQGLQVLDAARKRHRGNHPTCYACGVPQENRFQTQCLDCGAKYAPRGGR